jgi:hypothetical protein
MPERNRQDQKLVPFASKVVGKVSKMLQRLLQSRQPTKLQFLALSKCMQAAPGTYKLTAEMVEIRAAWDALSRRSKNLATNNTTTTTTAALT